MTISDPILMRDTSGKIRSWQYEIVGCRYRTIAGFVGGNLVVSARTTATPKNVGKSNAPGTPVEFNDFGERLPLSSDGDGGMNELVTFIRRELRRELLLYVVEREGGRCFYCDEPVSIAARELLRTDMNRACAEYAATLDHIIPQSKGGDDSAGNILCACAGCNQARGVRPAAVFLAEKMPERDPLVMFRGGQECVVMRDGNGIGKAAVRARLAIRPAAAGAPSAAARTARATGEAVR